MKWNICHKFGKMVSIILYFKKYFMESVCIVVCTSKHYVCVPYAEANRFLVCHFGNDDHRVRASLSLYLSRLNAKQYRKCRQHTQFYDLLYLHYIFM